MSATLTINSVAFRTPNRVIRVKNRPVISRRSFNNTLVTQVLDFTKKETLILEFDLLTNAERVSLETYIDTGAYTVVISDTGSFYTYNASSILTYGGYEEGFGGYKYNVKVQVQQI